jgi:hypothetical protein
MNEPEVMLEMLGGPVSGCRVAGGQERRPRTLAVVGLSDDSRRPSHSVSAYMQRQGYRIVPVNPEVETVLGERSYPSLKAVAESSLRPDVVNVFRLPKFIPGIVEEMIELGWQELWVQLGIRNEAAAIQAEASGIRVVMDRCILIEHARLLRR